MYFVSSPPHVVENTGEIWSLVEIIPTGEVAVYIWRMERGVGRKARYYLKAAEENAETLKIDKLWKS